jgi:hypothetical protein
VADRSSRKERICRLEVRRQRGEEEWDVGTGCFRQVGIGCAFEIVAEQFWKCCKSS